MFADLVLAPLTTGLAFLAFGLVVVVLGQTGDARARFRDEGMPVVPALIRAIAYTVVGSPLRLIRRAGLGLAASAGRALGGPPPPYGRAARGC
jgi:hypothetical protein